MHEPLLATSVVFSAALPATSMVHRATSLQQLDPSGSIQISETLGTLAVPSWWIQQSRDVAEGSNASATTQDKHDGMET